MTAATTVSNSSSLAPPRTPLRVLTILEILASHPRGLSLSQLSKILGAPKTSTFHLVRALIGTGHVTETENHYRLGPLAYKLGAMITHEFGASRDFKPTMQALCSRTLETIMLGCLDRAEKKSVQLDMVQPDVPVRFVGTLGILRPLYCTAVGLALLSFQDDAFIESYLRSETFVRRTQFTIAEPNELRRLIGKIKQNGVAISVALWELTAGGIAAPVFDQAGKVDYCISVAGPADRIASHKDEIAVAAHAAGRALSSMFGYMGPYPGA